MENEENIILVSRFFVEDNSEGEIEYDEDNSNDVAIIRSIMRHFLGNYKILDESLTQNTIDNLAKVTTPPSKYTKFTSFCSNV